MTDSYGTKSRPRNYSDVGSPRRLDSGVYHAKALHAQTRLHETLGILDEMERTHAEQLACNERREGKMRQKMKTYAEVSRKAEEETEDMRQALLKLIDKVEKHHGYKYVKPSQMHVSSLLEPIELPLSKRAAPADAEELLSYAASMIEVARKERNIERKAHQKTKEWAQARIANLEAQLARRDADLARCIAQCHDTPTVPAEPPVQKDYVSNSLHWAINKNKSLEMEIHSLNERLSNMRLRDGAGSPVQAQSDSTLVGGLEEQVRELGSLIDGLKQDRQDWRTVIDSEKQPPLDPFAERLRLVEEECARLRRSDEELRTRQREEEARAGDMRHRIEWLDSQINAITMAQVTPVQEAYEDGDTIRIKSSSPHSDDEPHSPDGEQSMDIATPLMPTIFMEPPALPLEIEQIHLQSPNPTPHSPSLPPSPFQLSPNVPLIVVQESTETESFLP